MTQDALSARDSIRQTEPSFAPWCTHSSLGALDSLPPPSLQMAGAAGRIRDPKQLVCKCNHLPSTSKGKREGKGRETGLFWACECRCSARHSGRQCHRQAARRSKARKRTGRATAALSATRGLTLEDFRLWATSLSVEGSIFHDLSSSLAKRKSLSSALASSAPTSVPSA